jgi:membrane dipeptidase
MFAIRVLNSVQKTDRTARICPHFRCHEVWQPRGEKPTAWRCFDRVSTDQIRPIAGDLKVATDIARSIVASSIVWDNHTCMPLDPFDERRLAELDRYAKAGVTVVGVNVGFGQQSIEQHVRMLAHFRRWLKQRPDEYLLVETVDDVLRAKQTGRLGVFFDIEGAGAIDDQLSLIQLYYDTGVRWMLVAYNLNNRVGGGCLDDDCGLTAFGRDVIDEMNRVGMMVCCSHTGERTSLDVIDHSAAPVIFSHSNPRAVWDHPRNIRDDVIRACAAKGGVIAINGVGPFLGANDTRSETVAAHIDYVAKLVGIDHVALGLDYVFDREELLAYLRANPAMFGADSVDAQENGCDFVAPEQISPIVRCLAASGYRDEDLEKVLGLNLLRIARAVWR